MEQVQSRLIRNCCVYKSQFNIKLKVDAIVHTLLADGAATGYEGTHNQLCLIEFAVLS